MRQREAREQGAQRTGTACRIPQRVRARSARSGRTRSGCPARGEAVRRAERAAPPTGAHSGGALTPEKEKQLLRPAAGTGPSARVQRSRCPVPAAVRAGDVPAARPVGAAGLPAI